MTAVRFESGAVSSYLDTLQSVVNRMAANSAGCKTWCITLVSAILVIVSDKADPKYIWITLVPLALFLFLDAYYLGLEKRFRDQYNGVIKKLHADEATIEDLYVVDPGGGFKVTLVSTLGAFLSLSIWPFYGLLIATLWAVKIYIFTS